MRIQYTHFHPVYGKLKFIRKSYFRDCAFFLMENSQSTLLSIRDVEIYKPNNLTNIPYALPIPMYSGTY